MIAAAVPVSTVPVGAVQMQYAPQPQVQYQPPVQQYQAQVVYASAPPQPSAAVMQPTYAAMPVAAAASASAAPNTTLNMTPSNTTSQPVLIGAAQPAYAPAAKAAAVSPAVSAASAFQNGRIVVLQSHASSKLLHLIDEKMNVGGDGTNPADSGAQWKVSGGLGARPQHSSVLPCSVLCCAVLCCAVLCCVLDPCGRRRQRRASGHQIGKRAGAGPLPSHRTRKGTQCRRRRRTYVAAAALCFGGMSELT